MGPAELTLGDASLITATFLFTDIEGSTNLWETESQAMRIALQRHNTLAFGGDRAPPWLCLQDRWRCLLRHFR
jgi:hypothetical protein